MSAEWHSSWLLVLVSSSVSPSSIPSLSGTQASVGAAAVKSGNFWSQLSRFPPSLSVPSLCTYLASQPMNIMKREYLPSVSLVELAETSWITFHRKLYHSEFPCNNPEEKLPICPFRPITPLVVLRLLHAHYFELMSFAAGGNLKEPVSGCQRQSMLGRYSWKSFAVKDQRNFSEVNFGHQYHLPMSLPCFHSFLSKHRDAI